MKRRIDFYSRIYAQTYKRRCIPMRFVVPFMNYLSRKANKELDRNQTEYISNSPENRDRKENLIVSLTSFPARIESVWKTIVSLKAQTLLPEKIILWLSKEEFANKKVPDSLIRLQDDIFEIRMVDGNLKSHKKYFYAFQEFPDYTIITLDDDNYYHKNLLNNLVGTSQKYPQSIIANMVYKIRKNKGQLLPYVEWKKQKIRKNDSDLFAVGVNGILYPPHSLDKHVLDKDLFLRLTPLADDVWLNACARIKQTPVVHTGWKYRHIPLLTDSPTLSEQNCGQNQNDKQLQNVRDYFKSQLGKDIYFDFELKPENP